MGKVITTFKEKKRQKQIEFEMCLLKDISGDTLHNGLKHFIERQQNLQTIPYHHLYDYCYELVVEAYLVGAKYSRFGYWGESLQDVKIRSMEEEMHIVNTLYQFFYFSGVVEQDEGYCKEMYQSCKQFVHDWWVNGYEKGKRRHLLRLS